MTEPKSLAERIAECCPSRLSGQENFHCETCRGGAGYDWPGHALEAEVRELGQRTAEKSGLIRDLTTCLEGRNERGAALEARLREAHVQACACHRSDPTEDDMMISNSALWHESHRHPYTDSRCASKRAAVLREGDDDLWPCGHQKVGDIAQHNCG